MLLSGNRMPLINNSKKYGKVGVAIVDSMLKTIHVLDDIFHDCFMLKSLNSICLSLGMLICSCGSKTYLPILRP